MDGYSWDYRGNDRLPVFDYGDLDPTDPTTAADLATAAPLAAASTLDRSTEPTPTGVDHQQEH